MTLPFVVKKRFVIIDTATNTVVAQFSNEQKAEEHARKLNMLRRKR